MQKKIKTFIVEKYKWIENWIKNQIIKIWKKNKIFAIDRLLNKKLYTKSLKQLKTHLKS